MKEENIPLLVKNQLNKAITETIAFHKAAFVHPAANFSRKRKLDIETMIKLLISMRGGSIDKELQSAFPHEKVSAAAFVKQRGKLSHKDFGNILDVFNTKGTIFSAIPVALLQGGVTALSVLIKPIMTETALLYLSIIGSILIFCVGINLVFGKKIRVANLLPAIILAVACAFLPINFL